MKKRRLVFRYGDLFEFDRLYSAQTHVAKCDTRGHGTFVYSTGRLETALRLPNPSIWIVISKSEPEAHDDWWMRLLPKEQVFFGLPRFKIMNLGWEQETKKVDRYPWEQMFEAAINIKLPRYIADADDAMKHLVLHHGFTLGSSILPWSSSNRPTE